MNLFMKNLIVSVKKNPCLYDQTDPNYRNEEYKESVWAEIASENKESPILSKARHSGIKVCKDKWYSLFNKYVRLHDGLKNNAIRRLSNSQSYIPPRFLGFPYYKNLIFLNKSILHSRTSGFRENRENLATRKQIRNQAQEQMGPEGLASASDAGGKHQSSPAATATTKDYRVEGNNGEGERDWDEDEDVNEDYSGLNYQNFSEEPANVVEVKRRRPPPSPPHWDEEEAREEQRYKQSPPRRQSPLKSSPFTRNPSPSPPTMRRSPPSISIQRNFSPASSDRTGASSLVNSEFRPQQNQPRCPPKAPSLKSDIVDVEVDFFFRSVSQQVKRANLSHSNFMDLQAFILNTVTETLPRYNQ
ncbi:Transcription factor Adf-1 [Sergentomyia squamirostris]